MASAVEEAAVADVSGASFLAQPAETKTINAVAVIKRRFMPMTFHVAALIAIAEGKKPT